MQSLGKRNSIAACHPKSQGKKNNICLTILCIFWYYDILYIDYVGARQMDVRKTQLLKD